MTMTVVDVAYLVACTTWKPVPYYHAQLDEESYSIVKGSTADYEIAFGKKFA